MDDQKTSNSMPHSGGARETSAFFALLSRTQLINRWSLMRNMWPENVQEHSFQTALIAQALVFIRRVHYPESGPLLDPDRVLARALFHDAAEVLTGDLPTPVKYHSQSLHEAFVRLEDEAATRLLALLPDELRACYVPYIQGTVAIEESADWHVLSEEERAQAEKEKLIEEDTRRIIKVADKISALIKCQLETQQGNKEFEAAEHHTLQRIKAFESPEADYFIDVFLPDYLHSLDHYNV